MTSAVDAFFGKLSGGFLSAIGHANAEADDGDILAFTPDSGPLQR